MELIRVRMVLQGREELEVSMAVRQAEEPGRSRYTVCSGQDTYGPYKNPGPALTKFHECVGRLVLSGAVVETIQDERRKGA